VVAVRRNPDTRRSSARDDRLLSMNETTREDEIRAAMGELAT
jgi:hypothetical protein